MSQRTLSGSLLHQAESLREEVEEMLLGGPEDDLVLLEALRSAEAAINRFFEHGPNDDGIAGLDSLKLALTTAAQASDGERSDRLNEACKFAATLRSRALDQLSAPSLEGMQAAFVFRASVGTPAPYQIVDLPPPELIAKRKEGDDPDLLALLAEEESLMGESSDKPPIRVQIERLGREAMEDLAILGGLRRLNADERWSDGKGFEARLLANLDALWSLDLPLHPEAPKLGVPMALYRYATEWSFPDWGRAFALAFGLACVESETAIRWVVLAARRADPAVLSAYVEALSLGANPGIDRATKGELAADNHGALMLAWLDVAVRRRIFDAPTMLPLLAHPDETIRLRVAQCFRAAPRDLALATLAKLLDDPQPTLRAQIADEMAARADETGLRRLRLELQSSLRSEAEELSAIERIAVQALALAGHPEDDALLLLAAQTRFTAPYFLGYYGRPTHVEWLLTELARVRPEGAQLFPRIEACEKAICRLTGKPTDRHIDEIRADLMNDRGWKKCERLRLGREHHVRLVVSELADPQTKQGDRRVLVRELAQQTPNAPRIDIDGWVARQAADLAMLGASG